MGANDDHPLNDLAFCIDDEGVIRMQDGTVCGNNTGTRASEQTFRQGKAAANAPTEQDWQLYRDFANNDPDFEAVRETMRELVDHVPDTDRQEIENNPRVFLENYMAVKDKLVSQVQDRPRVDGIVEIEDALKEQRGNSGGIQSRDLEHRLASRYLGGR